jgi:hypothetical protein
VPGQTCAKGHGEDHDKVSALIGRARDVPEREVRNADGRVAQQPDEVSPRAPRDHQRDEPWNEDEVSDRLDRETRHQGAGSDCRDGDAGRGSPRHELRIVAKVTPKGPPTHERDADDRQIDSDRKRRVILEAKERERIEGDRGCDDEQAHPSCDSGPPPLVGEKPPTAADSLVLRRTRFRDERLDRGHDANDPLDRRMAACQAPMGDRRVEGGHAPNLVESSGASMPQSYGPLRISRTAQSTSLGSDLTLKRAKPGVQTRRRSAVIMHPA